MLRKILLKVKPDEAERKNAEKILKRVSDKIKPVVAKYNAELCLVGSFARRTNLKGNKEFDLFILFPLHYSKEEIINFSEISLRKIFGNKLHTSYSEHKYWQYRYKGYKFDLVPAFKIKNISEKKTAVDRSPLHLQYLKKNLKEKHIDAVLLLKQMLKNNLLYGSGQDFNAFSGYLIELLVIHYGSFYDTIKGFSSLNEGAYLSNVQIKEKKEFKDAFVFIDPVDSSRNVAAALSKDNFERTKALFKMFLSKPDESFFFSKPKASFRKLLIFKKDIEKSNKDLEYGYIRSIAKKISKKYDKIKGFEVYVSKKSYFIFFVSSYLLDKHKIIKGPFCDDEKNLSAFLKKHKNVFYKKNRVFAKEEVKERKLKNILAKELNAERALPLRKNLEFVKRCLLAKKYVKV